LIRTKGQLKVLGNVGISNVRGPRDALRLGGIEVVDWLSIGQVTGGVGLNVTGWSYVDRFNICMMADSKMIPDTERFAAYLHEGFEAYRSAALTAEPQAVTGGTAS